MPRVRTSSLLSIIIVLTWCSVYFIIPKRPTVITEKIDKTDYDAALYILDDPNIGLNETEFVTNTSVLQIFAPAVEETNFYYNITLPEDNNAITERRKQMQFEVYPDYDTNNNTNTTSKPIKSTTEDMQWMQFTNLTIEEKKNHVKKMMKHAWDNYVKYSWGYNEHKPITKQPHHGSVFGRSPAGVTIIDSLDTLHVMGLMDEFRAGRDWVANEFNITALEAEYSVFEVNIRLVGGLLSSYALTGDLVFKEKAQQIADKLLPAFKTPTGIPHSLVEFGFGMSRNYGWASSGSSILAEIGTLHLEFAYLSDIIQNLTYTNKTTHVRKVLKELDKPNGLYPNYINPNTGRWSQHHSSVGSLGDSFYEYLLKSWLQSNKQDDESRQMYEEAIQAILDQMLQVSRGGLTYFAEKKYDWLEHRMEHLGCYTGGLLALSSSTLKNNMTDRYLEVAKEITNTCHTSYHQTYTKLGPEAFRFGVDVEARAVTTSEDHYILRPEVVESYFYLYRTTKDDKYREWGWEVVEALEKYCKVDAGYTGIRDVYSENPEKDDVQQSYFMSETLKYLYLLFSDDSVFSLHEWVFNTEAHPLPIKNINPLYRDAKK